MMVEQLGFAMMPPLPNFMPAIASGLTSGMTRGTPSVMRNALLLSTTVHPTSEAMGAYFLEMEPPAEKRAMSTPLKDFSVSSSTVYSAPSKEYVRPAERADASILMSLYGKSRSLRTCTGAKTRGGDETNLIGFNNVKQSRTHENRLET